MRKDTIILWPWTSSIYFHHSQFTLFFSFPSVVGCASSNCLIASQLFQLQKVHELRVEIQRLQEECKKMTHEVDMNLDSRVPLGETDEEFYKNIYTGQQGFILPPLPRPPAPSKFCWLFTADSGLTFWHFRNIQVDRRICGFSYPWLAAAPPKILRIKEINGSLV
jgi:hypothetical protein